MACGLWLVAPLAIAQTLPYQGTTTTSNFDLSAFKVINNTSAFGVSTAFRAEATNASGSSNGLYARGNTGVNAGAIPGAGFGVYSYCQGPGSAICYGVLAEAISGTGDAGVAGGFNADLGTAIIATSAKGRAIYAVSNQSGQISVLTTSIAGTALKASTVSGSALQADSQSNTYGAVWASNSGVAASVLASNSNASGGDAIFATSATGDGIEAKCTASNCQNGVYGFTTNPNASCVIGQSTASIQGFGVVGRSYGTGRGVYGELASPAAGGYAGFFQGATHVNGTLSKLSGTFKIDHPQDPANKFLVHSFVESPEMKNVYDGVATLGSDGSATVTLPSYFESLNSDFRYQLTPIGAPANLYVRREVVGGSFEIAGGLAGLRVSWQLTGVRKDAWAKANPIVVEQPKQGNERGRYLVPELISPTAARLVASPAEAIASPAPASMPASELGTPVLRGPSQQP